MHVFGDRVSVMFHLMCVHIILVRFWLLSGHLLGKNAYCVDLIFFILVLIVSVPGLCIFVYNLVSRFHSSENIL